LPDYWEKKRVRKQIWPDANNRVSGEPEVVHLNPDPGGGGIKSDQGEVENSTKLQVKKPTTQDTVKQYTVNVNVASKKKGLNPLHGLADKQTDKKHAALITEDILLALGDRKSARFYSLVARKVPESYIRRTLSELNNPRL